MSDRNDLPGPGSWAEIVMCNMFGLEFSMLFCRFSDTR